MGNDIASNKLASIDGTGHNSDHPDVNVANAPEARLTPANFAPGTTDGLVDGPNPREISNVVSSGPQQDAHDANGLSAMMYVWGQVLDHDVDLTPQDNRQINISIPSNDPTFPGGDPISLDRSKTDPNTGTAVNTITGWIDGSMIYGSSQATADSLRLPDGHLKTSDGNNLPMSHGMFVSGDVRVGENPDLTAITTLFVREHNFQVDRLASEHPDWSGDQLYQQARAIVIAEIQNITYSEFLPHLLGPDAIAPYHGFDPNADARISQEFSAGAFRFGHSIVSGEESKLDNQGNQMATQDLSDAFTDTPDQEKANGGMDALIRNFASDPTQANDVFAIDSLRNLLVAPPDFLDLIAIDIQRERDLGLGTLNQTREAYGLSPYTDFNQITSDPSVAANLQQEFGNVDNVDLFIGGLAEDHVNHAMVGSTFEAILTKQFIGLRDGDQLWWQNQGFDQAATDQIQNTKLADIITRNTNTNVVQSDVFVAADRHPSSAAPEDSDTSQLVMGVNDDNATIAGGPADDTIVAGLGQNQTLIGNGGKDVFVFSQPDQTATIQDFAAGMDKVEFKMAAGDFSIDSSDGHAVVHYNGATINLAGVNPDQISAKDMIFVNHS